MWPSRGTASAQSPLLGGDIRSLVSRCPFAEDSAEHREKRSPSLRKTVHFSVLAASILCMIYILHMSAWLKRPFTSTFTESSPSPTPSYMLETCCRLDSEFEFESPPDFSKFSLESWTECRPVVALDGWRVEHCTAPGSTWPLAADFEGIADRTMMSIKGCPSFLFYAKPHPEMQQSYSSSSLSPTHTIPSGVSNSSTTTQPMQCNPGGYFRVQRLFTPSTNYTIGSGAENPAVRCHNDPSVPIALNEATRAYVDNFAGPDTFRAVLTGPEYYLTQQQINLGNCVYALPYVLSRPGRFFLTKIEHLYQNFDALNENYNATFAPRYIGKNILPTIPSKPREPRWGDNQTTIEAWLNHKVAASKIHQFTVCGGCPQVFDPASWTTYDDLPICSLTAYDGARQHGVYAGRSSISQYQDLESQTYEWVGARPSCRHHPRLVTFTGPKTYTMETTAMPIGEPMYGGPSSSPSPDEFSRQHDATMNCLNRNRTIYFVGDSHIRVLYDGLVSRLQGVDGNLHRTKTYKTRYAQIGGVYIRQEFDQWLLYLNVRIRHVLAQGGQEQQLFYNDYHLLETFDTLVFDFGAWAAAGFGIGPLWTSDLMFGYIKKILWSIAQVRYERQIRYKMTGKGYPDLRIVWMGMVPWPDAKAVLDMRTNTRLKYWDLLIDSEIDKVNAHYSQWGGMIDRLGAFSKLIPYRHLSFDQAHHTEKRPVDALVQALIHKLDLCREEFEHDLPPLPEPDPEDLSIFPPAALFQEASLLFLEMYNSKE